MDQGKPGPATRPATLPLLQASASQLLTHDQLFELPVAQQTRVYYMAHLIFVTPMLLNSTYHMTPPQERHAGVRPWSEFLSIHRISKPKSSGDAIKRLFGNISRFQSNYLFVFLGLVLYCM